MNSIPKSDSILPVFKDLLLFCIICSLNSKQFVRASKAVHDVPRCLLWSHLPSPASSAKSLYSQDCPASSRLPHFTKTSSLSLNDFCLASPPDKLLLIFHSPTQMSPAFTAFLCFQAEVAPNLCFNGRLVPFPISAISLLSFLNPHTQHRAQHPIVTHYYANEDFELRKCFVYLSDIIWRFFDEI